jgi:hypothetical protein
MGTPRRRVHANRRLGAAVYPATAGLFPATIPLDFWEYGNDGGSTFSGTSYASIPNRGLVAPAQLTAVGTPTITARGAALRRAPLHTSIGAFNGDTLTAQRFTDPASSCELWVAIYVDSLVPASQRLIANRGATVGQRGFYLRLQSSGRLDLFCGDGGASDTLAITSGATGLFTAGSFRVLRVTKALLAYAIQSNGAAYVSASASALTAGASAMALTIGGGAPTGAVQVMGSICETLLTQRALTAGEATSMLAYFNGRWA